MNEQLPETVSFALIIELQMQLERALNSIADKTTQGEATYLIWCAAHVNKIAAGYCALRNQSLYSTRTQDGPYGVLPGVLRLCDGAGGLAAFLSMAGSGAGSKP
jgi:hypothetical protein